MSELRAGFVGLGPKDKAMFLARVAHMATIAARESYISSVDHPERSYDHPDAIILRNANEFVHRVAGHIMRVLAGPEVDGRDESFVMMIEQYFRERGLEHQLSEWFATSN